MSSFIYYLYICFIFKNVENLNSYLINSDLGILLKIKQINLENLTKTFHVYVFNLILNDLEIIRAIHLLFKST